MTINDELRAAIRSEVERAIHRLGAARAGGFVPLTDAAKRIGCCHETIRKHIRLGNVPPPTRRGARFGYFIDELPEVEEKLARVKGQLAPGVVKGRPRKSPAASANP